MRFMPQRAAIVARREYLAVVKRKAFVLTLVGIPAFYALLMFVMIKPAADEAVKAVREFKSLGVVDSSGLYAAADSAIRSSLPLDPLASGGPRRDHATAVRTFPDQDAALAALRAGQVQEVVVVPPDYLERGRARRYVEKVSLFNDSRGERLVTRWLSLNLVRGRVDSLTAERSVRSGQGMALYSPDRAGRWALKDDRRQLLDFFLPFALGLLLGLSIITGGQYLLQGVNEEKESRILESLLCTVTPGELIVGKLVGLGGAGLTLVAAWVGIVAVASAPMLAAADVSVSPGLAALVLAYFLLGYLFYGSIMVGVGAITNNMREAQQFSFMFTFMNFVPFYLINSLMGSPDSKLAVGISLFPPTAPVSMLMRYSVLEGHVPAWQIALSLGLLLLTALVALRLAARIFRVGLLMYGKTPNLPEILRWIGQK